MEQRRLSDARDLRAVAHPVRLSIIEQLTLAGPLTASQLGDRIDESPANCSWHLRKLAEHGFVEEAGGGRGRERPWKVTSQGMTWGEADEPAEAQVAGDALSQVLVERETVRLLDSRAWLRRDSAEWQRAAFTSQTMLWLTADELAEIEQTVRELFVGRLDRLEDPSRRPPGSRLCALMAWGIPTHGIADPTPALPDDDSSNTQGEQ